MANVNRKTVNSRLNAILRGESGIEPQEDKHENSNDKQGELKKRTTDGQRTDVGNSREGSPNLGKDDEVAEAVMASLKKLGFTEEEVVAGLTDKKAGGKKTTASSQRRRVRAEEMEEEEESEGEMEEEEFQDSVVEGVCKVLAELGVDVEDDEAEEEEPEGEEDDEGEEELDEISDLVASYLQNHPGPEAAAKLTSRLTASMNMSVMAVCRR